MEVRSLGLAPSADFFPQFDPSTEPSAMRRQAKLKSRSESEGSVEFAIMGSPTRFNV